MQTYTALRIHRDEQGGISTRFEELPLEQPGPGEVLVRVSHSGINYKDALAATGKGQILRRFPLTGGIDLAGFVVASQSPEFREGDAVLAHGAGLSETRDGGFAQYARLPANIVVPMPTGMDAVTAMGLGTAGYTAALALEAMERNGQAPELGPVLVTGATGGVGCCAIDLLAKRGYTVTALSGKPNAAAFLNGLGAIEVMNRNHWRSPEGPLAHVLWAGAIDNLGGSILADLLAQVRPMGNVACIGMAAGSAVATTVMPFILRGVNLLGISSMNTPIGARRALWQRLAGELAPRHLERIVTGSVELAQLPGLFPDYIAGNVRGRTVVRVP
jgi:NADPH2:quinone reductase